MVVLVAVNAGPSDTALAIIHLKDCMGLIREHPFESVETTLEVVSTRARGLKEV